MAIYFSGVSATSSSLTFKVTLDSVGSYSGTLTLINSTTGTMITNKSYYLIVTSAGATDTASVTFTGLTANTGYTAYDYRLAISR